MVVVIVVLVVVMTYVTIFRVLVVLSVRRVAGHLSMDGPFLRARYLYNRRYAAGYGLYWQLTGAVPPFTG